MACMHVFILIVLTSKYVHVIMSICCIMFHSLVDVHYHMLTFFLGYIYLGLA